MNKFKIMFKISLGSILKFFSILCLRLRAMHFSPLHKPTANLPGWMEIGVRFHALCTLCHMGSGPWTMVTGQWGECWWREGKWQISSVCTSSWEPWDGAPWQKAFPQDYFRLASLGTSVLTTLSIIQESGLQPSWPNDCLGVNAASHVPCQSSPVIHSPFWSWGNLVLLTWFGDAFPLLFSKKSENLVCSGSF